MPEPIGSHQDWTLLEPEDERGTFEITAEELIPFPEPMVER